MLGGVAGADARCQNLADSAGLLGTFKAWISDDTSDPLSTFNHSTVPYIMVNGKVVAYNWTDLTNGGYLRNPIEFDEEGNYSLTTDYLDIDGLQYDYSTLAFGSKILLMERYYIHTLEFFDLF